MSGAKLDRSALQVARDTADRYVAEMAEAFASTPVSDPNRRVVVTQGGGIAIGQWKRAVKFKREAASRA